MSKLLKAWRSLNTRIQKSGYDTHLHVAFGITAAAVTYWLMPDDMPLLYRAVISYLVPTILGTIKELTDVNFDVMDVCGYAIGACISLVCILLIF